MNRRWVAAAATVLMVGGFVQAEGAPSVTEPQPASDDRVLAAERHPSARPPTSGVRAPAADDRRRSARPGNLAPIRNRIARLERQVRTHQRTMNRMDTWFDCITHVGVDQIGDVEHRWGFLYDERDGTGLDTRTALVRHLGSGRPDLVMLRVSRTRRCLSRPTDPNGTGADARAVPLPSPMAERALRPNLRRLERSLNRLEKRIGRVESATERFDEWESCLSWLPVTEYGREYQDLGYLVDDAAGPTGAPDRYLPALDIDSSEWDDPDYQVLAFLGRDRPFSQRECENEPGEGVDRQVVGRRTSVVDRRLSARAGYQERLRELRRGVRAAAEDVEDLFEPVFEFVTFDECMFTLGVQSRAGYRYRTAAGAETHKSALSFDMTGLQLPDFDVMAFPGEEPPQIECNEDAGGQNTDE